MTQLHEVRRWIKLTTRFSQLRVLLTVVAVSVLLCGRQWLSTGSRVVAGELAPTTTSPSQAVDEELYLVLQLRYAYLFIPSDPRDPVALERKLIKARHEASRFFEYTRQKKFDPAIVAMYADLVEAIDAVTDMWVKAGRIDRDAVIQANGIHGNAGADAGGVTGTAIAAAPATGGISLIGGAATLLKQHQSEKTALEQLDESKRRAIEDTSRDVQRKLSSIIARAEVTAVALSKEHGWNASDTGLSSLTNDASVMAQLNDVSAAERWCASENARRPRDPCAVCLHALVEVELPNHTPLMCREAADRCVAAAGMIPAGEIYDEDRGMCYVFAGVLNSHAAFLELAATDCASAQHQTAIRATELFDAAAKYVNWSTCDEEGDYRLHRVLAMACGGRPLEALVASSDLYNLKKDVPDYGAIVTALLVHNGQHNEALKWIAYLLAKDPGWCRDFVARHPTLDALRAARPDVVADLIKVKWQWNVEWGVLNDDVVLTNDSRFTLTNVVLKTHIENAGKSYDAELRVERVAPGATHRFTDAVSVTGSHADKASATLTCDQTN